MRVRPNTALLAGIFFILTFALSGCILFFGDKFSEEIECPLDRELGKYLVKLGDESSFAMTLAIPKKYAPRCSTHYPVPASKPIVHLTFSALYPDMTPLNTYSRKTNAVNIHIKPSDMAWWGEQKNDAHRAIEKTGYTHDLTAYIQRNIDAVDDEGKKRYAPVKELENGFYALFDNWQPTYAVMFQRNPDGRVKNLFYCHMEEKSCSTGNIINGDVYRVGYSAYGIDYRNLPVVDEKVKSLILGSRLI
jgi:hypothetical protein